MTVYTYTKPVSHGESSGVVIYSDKAGRVPAPVLSMTGVPLPGSKLDKDGTGEWPQFTSTLNMLYYRHSNGAVVPLAPVLSFATPVSITGSRGTATATVLENLIQGLIAAGVPLIDNTTA